MSERSSRPKPVAGPTGARLAPDDLPSPDLKRWVAQRKAEVVNAVRAGPIGMEEVCARYGIKPEEFQSWRHLLDEHGLLGLRATRLRQYRQASEDQDRAETRSLGAHAAQ